MGKIAVEVNYNYDWVSWQLIKTVLDTLYMNLQLQVAV